MNKIPLLEKTPLSSDYYKWSRTKLVMDATNHWSSHGQWVVLNAQYKKLVTSINRPLVYSSTTAAQTNMRTKGDFRRCTMQKRTSKVCIYILPYSKNDAAVTLEKGTAAMEEQQLFTTG